MSLLTASALKIRGWFGTIIFCSVSVVKWNIIVDACLCTTLESSSCGHDIGVQATALFKLTCVAFLSASAHAVWIRKKVALTLLVCLFSVLQATFLPGLQETNGFFGFLLLSQTRSRYCCSWRIALSCGCEIGWEDQVTGLHHLHIRAICPNFPQIPFARPINQLVTFCTCSKDTAPTSRVSLRMQKTLLGSVCNCF